MNNEDTADFGFAEAPDFCEDITGLDFLAGAFFLATDFLAGAFFLALAGVFFFAVTAFLAGAFFFFAGADFFAAAGADELAAGLAVVVGCAGFLTSF